MTEDGREDEALQTKTDDNIKDWTEHKAHRRNARTCTRTLRQAEVDEDPGACVNSTRPSTLKISAEVSK